jgi:hypothetical protein
MSLEDLEGNNEEETNAIKQLIEKYTGDFGLDGEPLLATNLIIHKKIYFNRQTDKIETIWLPPKLKEQIKKDIDKIMKDNIIQPAASQYYSLTWIVSKHEDKEGNKRWRLVTNF